ncbi:NADPH-dependent FMN reductase [Corynebacterium freiburgense]|uniref:NADPH-dependent FMN reductase n=1 Tax=Corynebacterium freiburgense TaxID=556548 RepID=UPI0003F6E54C|nr:NAD(P)H-dependent oxidoreductase [Corynebacterium freiburgense]WJZ03889.1 FMN-dependent NADPH-azoreductase [Corynebacterium freiburgense]
MKIGIVVGSIREGRVGESIGQWVAENATGADFEIIDIQKFDLPLFTGDTPPMMLNKEYKDAKVAAFSKAIDDCQGFIFVTPEYNSSVPGAFKNAIDHLASEWNDKPVGYVGYSFGGGRNAVAHWRTIMGTLKVKDVPEEVSINLGSDVVDGKLNASDEQVKALNSLVERVIAAA